MKTSTRLAGVTGVATVAAATAAILLGTGTGNADPITVVNTPGAGKITSTVTNMPADAESCKSSAGDLNAPDGTPLVESPVVAVAEGKATLVISPLQPGTYLVIVECKPVGGGYGAVADEEEIVVTEAPPTTTPTTTTPKPNPWGSLGDIGTGSLGG